MINNNYFSFSHFSSVSNNQKRVFSLLDILIAFVPILSLGTLGTILGTGSFLGGLIVTLGYVLSIILAGALLKSRGLNWKNVGLARPKNWGVTILLSIFTVILAIIVMLAVQWIAIILTDGQIAPINQDRYNPLLGNPAILLIYIVLAWTFIAFGEEMFYRAFLINRLIAIFHNTKMGAVMALIVSSIIFGFVHLVEGPLGVINTAAMGFVLGSVYLCSRRNLWVTIIAHGLANTIRFTIMYFGVI